MTGRYFVKCREKAPSANARDAAAACCLLAGQRGPRGRGDHGLSPGLRQRGSPSLSSLMASATAPSRSAALTRMLARPRRPPTARAPATAGRRRPQHRPAHPTTRRTAAPPTAAATPVSRSPRRCQPATTAKNVPDSLPWRWSGTARCCTFWAKMAEIHVGGPGHGQQGEPDPQHGNHAEDGDGAAPHHDTGGDGPALVADPGRTTR